MMKVNRLWGLAALASLGVVSCTIADLKEGEAVGGGGSGAGKDSGAGTTDGGTKTNTEHGGSSNQTQPSSGSGGTTNSAGTTDGGTLNGGGTTSFTPVGGEAGQGGEEQNGGAGGAPACSPDLDTDPLNCGSCDHSCLGGECHAGECAPVLLAKGQARVQSLAADDKYVYWANYPGDVNVIGQGRIQRAAFTGDGKIETVASGLTNPAGIIVDQSFAYFSNPYCCNSTIQKVAKAGGSPTSLATGQSGPQGGVLYDGILYWPNHVASGSVMAVSISAGGAAPLYPNLDRPQWVAADKDNIYWAELEAGFIRKAARAGGGASSIVASGEANPVLLTLTPQYLFWANDTSMMRAPLSGGAGVAYEAAEGRPGDLKTDGKSMFWPTAQGIKMAGFNGGQPQIVVTKAEMGGIGSVVVEAKSIVWLDYAGGNIWRKAR